MTEVSAQKAVQILPNTKVAEMMGPRCRVARLLQHAASAPSPPTWRADGSDVGLARCRVRGTGKVSTLPARN
jgi:hypothetical protein